MTLSESTAAIQSAMSTLQRFGRIDDADPALTDAEASNSRYAQIDADTTASASHKVTQAAQVYVNVITTLARKLTSAAALAGVQDGADAARVFGVQGLAGDPAALSISRRDAASRVADITDNHQRRTLLTTAVRNGDDVLAHALVESAFTAVDVDTVNDFSAAYPQLAGAVERLWTSQQRKMSELDLTTYWRVAALKPAPLKVLQDYEIASAAAGNTNTGSWNV